MKNQIMRTGYGMGGFLPHAIGVGQKDLGVMPPRMDSHEYWMNQALLSAMNGVGISSPNPTVGCVIVKDQRMLAKGVTEVYGGRHAERVAVDGLKEGEGRGATAYVTLEPCSHHGKQPPCVEALVKAGIRRCFVGLKDPHLKVAGQGIHYLKEKGVEVTVGILEAECEAWHSSYLSYVSAGELAPCFVGKWAQTLDGSLADDGGVSQWISGPYARCYTHFLRQKYDAILVGAQTAIFDAPSLTVRDGPIQTRQPLKIIFDPCGVLFGLSVEQDQRLRDKTFGSGKVLVVTGKSFREKKRPKFLADRQDNLMVFVPDNQPVESLRDALATSEVAQLWGLPLSSVLVEGGSRVLSSMLRLDLLDLCHTFITPGFLGAERHRIFRSGYQESLNLPDQKKYQLVAAGRLGPDSFMEYKRLSRNDKPQS